MGSTGALLDLVGDIYDAAIEPTKWPVACERLGRLVGGMQTAIALHDTVSHQVSLNASWNVDPSLEEAMRVYFAINPLVPAIWHVETGEPFTTYGLLGEETYKNTRFYQKAAAPFDVGDSALTVLEKSVRKFGALSIQRHSDEPPFGERELALLRLLSPHIRRAVLIADLLDARALERDMLAAALDRLAVGIILTDAESRIVHTNGAAGRMFEDGSAVRRVGDQLAVRDANAARELSRAIGDAASGTTIDMPRSGIVVPLKSEAGCDLAAWVLPLDSGLRRELAAGFAAHVAVFIRELGDTSPFPAELFVRRYAITPAESRVMMLIMQGMTIAETAEALGISLPTARTHLARLFDKTGTSRQADLVRLAMSALAPTAAN